MRSSRNGRPEARRSSNKEISALIQKARDQGWTVLHGGGGHFIFRSPDKSVPQVSVPSTPGGGNRSIENTKARLRKSGLVMNGRCPSCGGVSHPATGSLLPSGEIVCGPCVRDFWAWASEHGKKTYRVGKKGKGSKYIAFPTGITKKNPREEMAMAKRRELPFYMIEAARAVVGTAKELGVDPSRVGAPLAAAMRSIRHDITRSKDPESFVMGLMTAGDDPMWVLREAGVSANRRRRTSRRRTSRRRTSRR